MDPSTAAAMQMGMSTVQSGGNVLSTLLTNQANAQQNADTRAYNLKLWQMQNDYNAPSAQMARFKQAGLNTNLMYTQGNSGNAAPPAPGSPVHYQAPSIDLPNVLNIINQYADYLNKRQDIRVKQAQEDYITQQGSHLGF